MNKSQEYKMPKFLTILLGMFAITVAMIFLIKVNSYSVNKENFEVKTNTYSTTDIIAVDTIRDSMASVRSPIFSSQNNQLVKEGDVFKVNGEGQIHLVNAEVEIVKVNDNSITTNINAKVSANRFSALMFAIPLGALFLVVIKKFIKIAYGIIRRIKLKKSKKNL